MRQTILIAVVMVTAAVIILAGCSLSVQLRFGECSHSTVRKSPLKPATTAKSIVVNVLGPWREAPFWGSREFRIAKHFSMTIKQGYPTFIVNDPNSLRVWVRYGLSIDVNKHPILILRYRAKNLATGHWYSLWLDDGTGPAGGGIVPLDLSELKQDGQIHKITQDLRQLKPKGPIIGMAIGVLCRGTAPATFELLDLRFESPCCQSETNASLTHRETTATLVQKYEFPIVKEHTDGFISWKDAVALINQGYVRAAGQSHSLHVTIDLKDGREFQTVEPEIDAIFKVVKDAKLAEKIPVGSE